MGTSAPADGGAPVFGEPADHPHRVHAGQEVSYFFTIGGVYVNLSFDFTFFIL